PLACFSASCAASNASDVLLELAALELELGRAAGFVLELGRAAGPGASFAGVDGLAVAVGSASSSSLVITAGPMVTFGAGGRAPPPDGAAGFAVLLGELELELAASAASTNAPKISAPMASPLPAHAQFFARVFDLPVRPSHHAVNQAWPWRVAVHACGLALKHELGAEIRRKVFAISDLARERFQRCLPALLSVRLTHVANAGRVERWQIVLSGLAHLGKACIGEALHYALHYSG